MTLDSRRRIALFLYTLATNDCYLLKVSIFRHFPHSSRVEKKNDGPEIKGKLLNYQQLLIFVLLSFHFENT